MIFAKPMQRTLVRCFAALRQLRQIRRAVPTATFQMLVVALVHSLLDYCNAVLVGIPTCLVRRLQSVLNAAARLIYHLRPHDHITEALSTMHWLRVPERVQYKIAYTVLHDSAPRYLGPLVVVADLHLVGVLCSQQVQAAWSYRPSNCLLLAAVHFRLLQPKFGTACQRPSSRRHHCSLIARIKH